MNPASAKHASTNTARLKQLLPWSFLACSALLFGLHFFLGGGSTKLINDSRAYLAVSQGEQAGIPFDSRVLGPFIAWLITTVSGASSLAAFQILTLISFIASLLLLRTIIVSRGGPVEWQAAVLLAFGCALAVTFGYTPVMVDPLLLLLACLTVIALDRKHWSAVVVLASLAALTKEYGLLLGLVGSLVAWRRGHPKLALATVFLPTILLLLAILTKSDKATGMDAWHDFLNAMFGYHTYLFHFRGAFEYPKLLYMWSWSVLWPVLVIGASVVVFRLRKGIERTDHEVGFSVMLLALPILLLGDWGRTLLIAVPLACAVATRHPLARDVRFATLIGLGGLSTALARPFHGEAPPPSLFTLSMTAISAVSSLVIGLILVRHIFFKHCNNKKCVADPSQPDGASCKGSAC